MSHRVQLVEALASRAIQVKVPPGVKAAQRIKLEGKGDPGVVADLPATCSSSAWPT